MFTFTLYWFNGESHHSDEEKAIDAVAKAKSAEGDFGRLTEDVSFAWSLNEDDTEVLDMLFPAQALKPTSWPY